LNPLHLSGYGVKIRVENLKSRSELEVTDGREDTKQFSTLRFRPRRFPYSSIIIDGHSGYISLQAFHWLSKNKIPVFVMNFDGTVISSVLPPIPVKADLRAAQFEAAANPKVKFKIAKALVQTKIARSLQVLDWLAERYDIEREVRLVKKQSLGLGTARTVVEIRSVEGRVAAKYWGAYAKVLPERLDFQGRMTSSHQNDATDPVNAALNYGYGVLEGECRRAINAVGLEPSVGFLHDFSNYQTKQSLIYDLQEPFRWLIDLTVMQAFESRTLAHDDSTETLASCAEDFVEYVFQVQDIADGKGSKKLAKISDLDQYWNEIEQLVDIDGQKISAAINSVTSGQFTFTFDPYKGIRKILQDKVPQNDPDVCGVRKFFHETLAKIQLEARYFLTLKEQPQKTNPVYASYAADYEGILRHGFIRSGPDANVVADFRRYSDLVRIDVGDLLRRIHEQVKFTESLRQLLVNAGKSVSVECSVRIVLDAYWRMCELCYPFLDVARIAIELRDGKTPSKEEPTLDQLVKFLRDHSEGRKLVNSVEPVLRNSEAHCAASVDIVNGNPFVVAYESRSYPAREITRFPYSEVQSKTNSLKNSAVIAFNNTLILFEYAFLILVLNSYEFKLRLVTVGQY